MKSLSPICCPVLLIDPCFSASNSGRLLNLVVLIDHAKNCDLPPVLHMRSTNRVSQEHVDAVVHMPSIHPISVTNQVVTYRSDERVG